MAAEIPASDGKSPCIARKLLQEVYQELDAAECLQPPTDAAFSLIFHRPAARILPV